MRAVETLRLHGVRQGPEIMALAGLEKDRVWPCWSGTIMTMTCPGPMRPSSSRSADFPTRAGSVLVQHYRIDRDHSNAFEAWKRMGSPPRPTAEQTRRAEAFRTARGDRVSLLAAAASRRSLKSRCPAGRLAGHAAVVNQGARACEKWENEREFIDSARLQGWIGPGFPSEWAGTGLTSLKQAKGVEMPSINALRLRQACCNRIPRRRLHPRRRSIWL